MRRWLFAALLLLIVAALVWYAPWLAWFLLPLAWVAWMVWRTRGDPPDDEVTKWYQRSGW